MLHVVVECEGLVIGDTHLVPRSSSHGQPVAQGVRGGQRQAGRVGRVQRAAGRRTAPHSVEVDAAGKIALAHVRPRTRLVTHGLLIPCKQFFFIMRANV